MDRDEVQSGDIKAVYVWVCILHGGKSQVAIRARETRARKWVEGKLPPGEWTTNTDETRLSYRPEEGPDSGSIQMCAIPDAAALLVED